MMKTCCVCGSDFDAVASAKCCSPVCSKARIRMLRAERERKPKRIVTKTCVVCGKTFEVSGRGCCKRKYCSEKCKFGHDQAYQREYQYAAYHNVDIDYRRNNTRASGLFYENSAEKIAELRRKYKNGVPNGEIEKWIGGLK